MKTSSEKHGNEFRFVVSDVPEKLRESLVGDYFTQDGDRYYRAYPADAPHIEASAKVFVANAEKLIGQCYGAEPVDWESALDRFASRLRGKGIEWLLIGSCPLAIRGIDVKPRGVDVVMRLTDFERVRELFANDMINPLMPCDNWVAKAFGVVYLGAPVSIAFGTDDSLDESEPIDSGPYAVAHAEAVTWRGHELRVPPIELSLNINRRRGRHARVQLIEEFIKAQ